MTTNATLTNKPLFDVIEPRTQTQPFVFNSPHSGTDYPAAFIAASRLTTSSIRRSEDLFVDEIFMEMPRLGAPLLRARFPRAYLDVNREPYELDPNMFKEPLPAYANIRSMRVAGGLGTIARVVAEGQEIYREKINLDDAIARIETVYRPYHAKLKELLRKTVMELGYVCLVDCHSMPSGNLECGLVTRPDFVLGDRYGTSCNSVLTDMIGTFLTNKGYSVARNKPYAGGFITEHYGTPKKRLHAIQIEINRGLYADEQKLRRNARFCRVKRDLTSVFQKLFKQLGDIVEPTKTLAAE